MLNWLSSSKGKKASSSLTNAGTTNGNASIIYVDDKDPEIIAEPIFDEDPALYILFPHANNPGSQAPKVRFHSRSISFVVKAGYIIASSQIVSIIRLMLT